MQTTQSEVLAYTYNSKTDEHGNVMPVLEPTRVERVWHLPTSRALNNAVRALRHAIDAQGLDGSTTMSIRLYADTDRVSVRYADKPNDPQVPTWLDAIDHLRYVWQDERGQLVEGTGAELRAWVRAHPAISTMWREALGT